MLMFFICVVKIGWLKFWILVRFGCVLVCIVFIIDVVLLFVGVCRVLVSSMVCYWCVVFCGFVVLVLVFVVVGVVVVSLWFVIILEWMLFSVCLMI